LTGDTLSANTATSGGGVWNDATTAVSDSILSDSPCVNVNSHTITDGGYNVESDNTCGFGSTDVTNSSTIDLAPSLAANGSTGPETLAIGPGSSAFEEVPIAACTISTDERGLPRPGIPGTNCDAGAFEYQGQAAQAITFTSTPPANPTVGDTYTVTATGGGSGNPVTFSTANPSVCTVSGSTVTLVGPGTCVIDADQAGNSTYSAAPQASQSFPVSAGVAITATLPGGTVGVAYNAKLTATGGTPPYTWSIVSGTLPPGLSLAADGTVSGTPTAAGTYQLTVQVDGSATKAMTVVIAAAPATPTPPQAAPATPTPPQAAQAAAPSSSSQIPFTGADTTSTVGGAIALLLLGAGLVVATRRRPHGKHYAR
jgi:hypothetical protein